MSDFQLTSAQRELLTDLPTRFSVATLDRIWIFSAHVGKLRETGVLVISLLPAAEQKTSHRSLFTLRYRVDIVDGKVQRSSDISEEGRAPPERIDRVIEGVLARSGGDAGEPLLLTIEGETSRWEAVLAELGAET